MKLALCAYTNKSSGIGVFCFELWKYLGADSILSIDAGIKGQEVWTERQLTVGRPPTVNNLEEFFETYKPDLIAYVETPFSDKLLSIAHRHNCKVVGIVMHETYNVTRLAADALICPCETAWSKALGKKYLLFLPIGLSLFPYRERTGHTFNASIGYGGVNDRRQIAKVVPAFRSLDDPNARLIINSQASIPMGVNVKDDRITVNHKTFPEPKDVYAEGDISILPIAYGGYERNILESMASGMPCLTMDADPMNLFQHDPDFLIQPCKKWILNGQWVANTVYNEVSIEDLKAKMEWLLTIDTEKYSLRARAQAEAQSWESEEIPYRQTWLDTLERVCS